MFTQEVAHRTAGTRVIAKTGRQ